MASGGRHLVWQAKRLLRPAILNLLLRHCLLPTSRETANLQSLNQRSCQRRSFVGRLRLTTMDTNQVVIAVQYLSRARIEKVSIDHLYLPKQLEYRQVKARPISSCLVKTAFTLLLPRVLHRIQQTPRLAVEGQGMIVSHHQHRHLRSEACLQLHHHCIALFLSKGMRHHSRSAHRLPQHQSYSRHRQMQPIEIHHLQQRKRISMKRPIS